VTAWRAGRVQRRRPTARSVLAASALCVLVVGVPLVLLWVGGSPFPRGGLHRIWGMARFRQGFDSHVATSWLLHGSLILAWLTWAWMVVCVLIELRSWVTGRTPPHLPGSRTMQSIAACLVGTTLALVSMSRLLPAPLHGNGSVAVVVGQRLDSTGPDRSIDIGSPRVPASAIPVSDGRPDRGNRLGTAPTPLPVVDENGLQLQDSERRHSEAFASGTSIGEQHAGSSADEAALGTHHQEAASASASSSGFRGRSVDRGGTNGTHVRTVPERLTSSERLHVVQGRETLWSIAESRLGSARRWREVANLNYGHRQSDGGALSQSHWVKPGWTLRLPSSVPQTSMSPVTRRTSGKSEEGGGRSEDSRSAVEAEATQGRSRPGSATGIAEQDTEVLPGSRPPAVLGGLDSTALDGTRTGSDLHAELTAVGRSVGERPGPIELMGAGLLGAGVVDVLGRMRRAQQRHRPDGGLIAIPSGDLLRTERRLRAGNGQLIRDELDAAFGLFQRTFGSRSGPPPEVQGVQIRPDRIELLLAGSLAEDDRVPFPWERSDDPPSLAVEVTHLVHQLTGADGGSSLPKASFPTMVTVGRSPDGPLLVHLEAIGSLGLSGPPSECMGILRATAVELATSRAKNQFDLVLIGVGEELAQFDRVTFETDAATVLHQVHQRRLRGDEVLRSRGLGSFAEARWTGLEGYDPMVVVVGPDVVGDDLIDLVSAACDPRTALSVVAFGEGVGARYTLRVPNSGGTSALEPLGPVVFPQQISNDDQAQLGGLVALARDLRPLTSGDAPYVSLAIPLPDPAGPSQTAVDDISIGLAAPVVEAPLVISDDNLGSGDQRRHHQAVLNDEDGPEPAAGVEVEVAILGPVEVRGAARPFTRAWAKELVVYLAMHPNGATNDGWATALWPDRLMASSSLHSTASVARRALGNARDGRDHLPRAHGRLTLAASVGTDWARFVQLSDANRVSDLRQALELIRGRPFDGLRASDWPILEGIAPAIEASVVDVAGRLAGLYLRQGDPAGAEWAARKGLVVSPYDERLYRMLLRTAETAGNPAGVESVMSELLHLVADDVEPFDSVHPSTMELYRSLTRHRHLASSLR